MSSEVLWSKFDVPIFWLEDVAYLAGRLEECGIVYIGQLAALTEARFIEETGVLGGLDRKAANEAMYRLTVVLMDMDLQWGMPAEAMFGWAPPCVREFHAQA